MSDPGRARFVIRARISAVAIVACIALAGCSSAPSEPPSPSATGPVLTAAATGPLVCTTSPMGCVLSLEVVPGSGPWEPPVGYAPPPDRQFQPTQAENVLLPPRTTPMSVAPGRLRVIAILTIVSDVVEPSGPSYMGVAWRCQTELDVKPATKHVSVTVALQGVLPCKISATVE